MSYTVVMFVVTYVPVKWQTQTFARFDDINFDQVLIVRHNGEVIWRRSENLIWNGTTFTVGGKR